MPRAIIAACRSYPILSESNAALANALRNKGFEVDVISWNAAVMSAFLDSDIVLLRQTWDYLFDIGPALLASAVQRYL